MYPVHHGVTDVIESDDATGLPLSFPTLANALSGLGYEAHATGKWHVGFYREEYTPTFRGFQSFLGLYGGGEDHFTHRRDDAYDLHWDSRPACGVNCSQTASWLNGTYSTEIFTARAVEVVDAHDPNTAPLFLAVWFQASPRLGALPFILACGAASLA